MTWVAPWALAAAAAAAIGIGLLHLLARDRPERYAFPTARFVAPGSARATRRARTPRDPWLLALRVLALLLAGIGIAGPVLAPAGGSIGRVLVVDARSVAVARAQLGPGDRVVLFDSTARVVAAGEERAALDSVVAPATLHDASLSAGLVAGMRAAGALAADVDSVALVVVSPLIDVEDRATVAIREAWAARVELVRDSAGIEATDTSARAAPRIRTTSDAVAAAARLVGAQAATTATTADSAFARAGGMLVVWRADSTGGEGEAISGFVVGDLPVLYAARRMGAPPPGRVIARWIDGAPAATETTLGDGCIRHVTAGVPAAGDLTLRPAFLAALRALTAPCGPAMAMPSDSLRTALARGGPLASAAALREDIARSPATPWLLGAALVLLLLEPLLRRAPREVAA